MDKVHKIEFPKWAQRIFKQILGENYKFEFSVKLSTVVLAIIVGAICVYAAAELIKF